MPSTDEGVAHAGHRLDLRRRFALTTLPPYTGHFSYTAYSMPGTVKSMPKIGLPGDDASRCRRRGSACR